jgi:hypothetical protein
MKNGVLRSNGFFNSLDDLDISVIVFLKELEIKSVSDLSLENIRDLRESLNNFSILSLSIHFYLSFDVFQNFALESLVLFITNVKGDLVSIKVQVIFQILNQLFE